MQTSDNELSVYLLDDKAAQIDSVMTAHAATRDRPANIDCVLLDAGHLDRLSVRQVDTAGTTPNAEVNRLHRDLAGLTAKCLVDLAELFYRHGEFEMRLKKSVMRRIIEEVRAGAIEPRRLNKKMSKHISGAI